MNPLDEDAIELAFVEMLQEQGYKYLHGKSLERSYDTVLLEAELRDALRRLNPNEAESVLNQAYTQIQSIDSNDLMNSNEAFHTLLVEGVEVEAFVEGETVGKNIKVIDFENFQNNSFLVVNQFIIKENNNEKRLDIVVFVNGLPLVVVELKNATDEKATLHHAYRQIQNYKSTVPSIFNYNAFCVISDGIDAGMSSLSAPFSRFLAWKSPDKSENGVLPELQIMVERLFEKEVFLKLVRYNTVFEKEEVKDKETGIKSLVTIKKVAAYHQYYAVEKAVAKTIEAMKTDHKIGNEKPNFSTTHR